MKLLPNVTAEDVFISVLCAVDTTPPPDQIGNPASVRAIERQLSNGNEWAWCIALVRADFQTEDGREYSAETWLSGCSYKSRIDFIKNSCVYEDMLAEVLADINSQIAA